MSFFKNKPKKYLLVPIFITICLDFISMGVIVPVLGPLFLSSNQLLGPEVSASQRTVMLGLLVGAFPLAAFFGAPIMGALSDKFGRKKTINVTLIINFFCYLVFAFGIGLASLPLMFLGRLASGFAGATTNTCIAAMVDITNPKERVKNFGLIGVASFACGFILGPVIASFYTNKAIMPWFSPATPFYFVAMWCLMNLAIVQFLFTETLKIKSNVKISPFIGLINIYKSMQIVKLRNVFIVVFLVTFAFNFFAGYFQTFLVQKFHFNTANLSSYFAVLGISMAITQGLIIRFVPKNLTPEAVLLVCLPFLALLFPAIIFPNDPMFLYYLLPFISIFQGVAWPYSSAVISNLASDKAQGEMLGINASLQALAQTLPPILAGFIAVFSLNLPLIVGGLSALIAWLLTFYIIKSLKIPLLATS